MSWKVFLKMRSSEPSRYGRSQSCLNSLKRSQHREQAEVHRAHVERGDLGLEVRAGPQALLDEHRRRAAGGDVDHHVGASCLIRVRNGAKASGRWSGRPSSGSRACRCTIAAPASYGADRRVGDLVGRDRQVRRHRRRVDRAGDGAGDDDLALLLRAAAMRLLLQEPYWLPCFSRTSSVARLCAASAARRLSRHTLFSATCCADGAGPQASAAFRHCAVSQTDAVGQVGHVAAEPGRVALAVVGDARRGVQLDRLERAHEGPAQAEAVGDRVVEVLRAHARRPGPGGRLRSAGRPAGG